MLIIVISFLLAVVLGISILIPVTRKSGPVKGVLHSGSKPDKPVQDSRVFTAAEVSVHNKRTDCWIIIKDKVYDVTPYVEEHPGGDAILAHAGDDSTEGFFGPQHATRVFDMIEDFYVGNLAR